MALPDLVQEPITLYNASDRFALVEREVVEMQPMMDELKYNAHPAVLDLALNLLMIEASLKGMEPAFKRSRLKFLKSPHLKALADLEVNIYLFRDTLTRAHKELVGG